MTLKFAHLVAIQFGIFVGVVACLLFFRFDYGKPRTAAEMRERATEIAAVVKSLSEPEDQRTEREQDSTDTESAQLVPGQLAPALPNEYSPEAVEQYRALAAKLYYEQIAPRRTVSATLSHSSNVAVAPSSTEAAQEPAVAATYEPAPEPVAYVEPAPVIVYSQPIQYVAFSHPRRFDNRCRPAPHRGTFGSNRHRRPDRRGNHLSGSHGFSPSRSLGVVHHRKTGVPSCPSPQGFKSRGKR
jgi:hypothetical protein